MQKALRGVVPGWQAGAAHSPPPPKSLPAKGPWNSRDLPLPSAKAQQQPHDPRATGLHLCPKALCQAAVQPKPNSVTLSFPEILRPARVSVSEGTASPPLGAWRLPNTSPNTKIQIRETAVTHNARPSSGNGVKGTVVRQARLWCWKQRTLQ